MLDDTIRLLVKKAQNIEAEIVADEEALSRKKMKLQKIYNDEIPTELATLGLSAITTTDGMEVEIKPYYDVKQGDREVLTNWLVDHGMGTIIREEFSFAKGQDLNGIKEVLSDLGLDFQTKEEIHWKSLQKAMKEHIEEGGDYPPPEAAMVQIFQRATVKEVR